MIDGEPHVVSGVGQGRDAKDAESDAKKRAAMNTGLGLDLWAQDEYWLDKAYGSTVQEEDYDDETHRPFE